MRKLGRNPILGFAADESGNVLIEKTIILAMIAALTDGSGKPGFLMTNDVTPASATSAAARRFALDAPVSSPSSSSTPSATPEPQLPANSGLRPATPEQTIGRV